MATLPHTPRNDMEIELRVGDRIGIAGNHWDGLSLGLNRRTKRRGLFPSFKAQELVETAQMPSPDLVDNSTTVGETPTAT